MRFAYLLDGVAALDRASRAGAARRGRSRSSLGDGDSGSGTGVPALFSSWGWGGDRKDGEDRGGVDGEFGKHVDDGV